LIVARAGQYSRAMLASGTPQRVVSRVSELICDEELLAYTLLENARLRCEYLLQVRANKSLITIRRDLGLAGYHVSTQFYPALRAGCLAVAHHDANAAVHDTRRSELRAIFEHVVTAGDALTGALAITPRDYLHLAHLHVASAAESLDQELEALYPLS
jgi:AraC-like DNA-binding protein